MWEVELIQICALRNIFPELSYKEAHIVPHLCTVEIRLTTFCSDFFSNIQNESQRLYYLLPEVAEDY